MRAAPGYLQLPARARAHLDVGSRAPIHHPYETATWRTIRPSGAVLYLKAGFADAHPTLAAERDRCLWLRDRGAPVPEVVDHGSDGHVAWLLTTGLPGVDATAAPHLGDPHRTVPVLAAGLRAFHEIDAGNCPFDYRVDAALAHVAQRVAAGAVEHDGFDDVHRHLDPETALTRLRSLAVTDRDVVVCHGDYCPPNVMIDGGRVVGYLDLGEVGLADRWRDLAVATWSVTWNFGPGHEDRFLDAYGTSWDPPRRDFYRLLYDLES